MKKAVIAVIAVAFLFMLPIAVIAADRLIWYYYVIPLALEKFEEMTDGKYEEPPYYAKYSFIVHHDVDPRCKGRRRSPEAVELLCYRPDLHDYVQHVVVKDYLEGALKLYEIIPNCTGNCIDRYGLKVIERNDLDKAFIDRVMGKEFEECHEFHVAFGYDAEFCERVGISYNNSWDGLYKKQAVNFRMKLEVPHTTLDPFVRGNRWVYGLASIVIDRERNRLIKCSKYTRGTEKRCTTLGG